MEYYNNKLCASRTELEAIMSVACYDKLAARGKIDVCHQGKGRGNHAKIVVDSLPSRYKEKFDEQYPNASIMRLQKVFEDKYSIDNEARSFFSRFRFESGDPLPPEKINAYTINASVIMAVKRIMMDTNARRRAQKDGKLCWDDMAAVIAFYKEEYGHTLPESTLRFRKRVAAFNNNGYESLISGKFKNQNKRKVTYQIERLVLSIDSLPERPFNTTVHELYNAFVCGELDVYDPETGELYDPEEYTDKSGDPVVLSESTIANILNDPKNKALRSNLHDSYFDFNNNYRPHHNRIIAKKAFSKISMDDRDLPRKMHDGNRVKAYYSYDVASGCIIGYAYSRLKTNELFLACVRNMFQFIDRQGWNCPGEVEVEHHLVNNFADTLMQAQVVFPIVRWCNPGNSQEKRAEHFNRAKKYGVEKRLQTGIGRWYSPLEANRPKEEKVYDEFNNTWKTKTYTYEELVADDIRAIHEYNNQKHPNQKYFKGMTRWQVLCETQNPDLKPTDKVWLYRYIGDKTETSIRRNMYCTVHGVKFGLPTPELIEKLAPNNYKVQAYYVPDNEGNVSEVYLWQDNQFIAVCKPVALYSEAKMEQTEVDELAYLEQSKYISQFDAMIKRDKIRKVKTVKKAKYPEPEEEPETVAVSQPIYPDYPAVALPDFSGYAQRALEAI